jgi:hypothetical protein
MARRGNSLFRAVVVLGAALPACAKSERLPRPAPTPHPSAAVPVEQTATVPTPAASPSQDASATTSTSIPPLKRTAPNAVTSAPAGRRKAVTSRPCPPDSEMPFPPCYYIL